MKLSAKNWDINSPWTSLSEREGWVQFRISGRRHGDAGLEIEMMAVCDRKVRFWVPGDELKDAAVWRPGWH